MKTSAFGRQIPHTFKKGYALSILVFFSRHGCSILLNYRFYWRRRLEGIVLRQGKLIFDAGGRSGLDTKCLPKATGATVLALRRYPARSHQQRLVRLG